MKEQKKKRHIEGMDALRDFAILGVVLYHVMPGRFPGGFLGVNMFLVLSGYLIYKTSVWDLELVLGTNGTFSDAVGKEPDSCDWKGPEDLLGHSPRGAFAVAGRG